MDSFAKQALEASGLDYSDYVPSSEPITEEPAAQVTEEETQATGIDESILSDLSSTSNEANVEEEAENTDSQEENSSDEEAGASKKGDVDYVYATGPKGRKKIKVDYSNKEVIKKAHQKAAAADLYRLQRDAAKKEAAELKELAEHFKKLDQAYEKESVLGVVKSMKGGQEALDALIEAKLAEREAVAAMSPEERRAWELEQETIHGNKEVQRLREQLEAREARDREREEQAKVAEVERLVTPAFDRYRFKGKLNNEEHEYILDKMLWTQVEDELNELPEEIPLTQALVDRAYRNNAAKIRKMMSLQAEKKVKKIVDKKKANALASTQVAASKKIQKKDAGQTIAEDLQKGNFNSLINKFFNQ